jgi:hypothetical protein
MAARRSPCVVVVVCCCCCEFHVLWLQRVKGHIGEIRGLKVRPKAGCSLGCRD